MHGFEEKGHLLEGVGKLVVEWYGLIGENGLGVMKDISLQEGR